MDEASDQEHQLRGSADYRRLSIMLGTALVVLIGATIYLVARDRLDTWAAARNSTKEISTASQISISGLLVQSTTSLEAIRPDIMQRGTADRIRTLAILSDAMRFDPLSSYLGVKRAADRSIIAVNTAGKPVSSAIAAAMQSQLVAVSGTKLEVSQLIQIPGDATWYLPLMLAVHRENSREFSSPAVDEDILFALVSGPRLVAGVKDIYPASDAFVAVLANDGRRLIKYHRGSESFQFNGRPIRSDSVAIINRSDTGNFETWSSLDGVQSVFGFAHSALLPIVVVTGVPVSTLNAKWMKQSVAPTILLLLGVGGIVIFGFRLRIALRKQSTYLRKQEYLANYDTLTGLRNRDSFMRMLELEIKSMPSRNFGVVLMDLNNFKDINDTLGHAAGDQLLCEIGRRLTERLKAYDSSVARLGGDELGIYIRKRSSVVDLTEFSAELQECISRRACIDDVELEPAASMGGAMYPKDALTPSELMRCADIAMYAAKTSGQPFCRYSERMDLFSPDRLAMKAELATAIREGGLHFVYQPKVRLSDGLMVGCEALARWVDPMRGPILPVTFIPIVERSELIYPFTEYVLRTALIQMTNWRLAGREISVAVNISANNLHDERFIETVVELLGRNEIPPSLLELEITESAVMRNPEATIERLCELRNLGIHLSIDDFGTGHASLAYLKHLPVHTLKIDKAFVSALNSDAADRKIVSSTIKLAHDFGMTVVAEGVESEATAALLEEYGCDYAQGYYFARPLTVTSLESDWFEKCVHTSAA